ncbi:hypothetical protein [Deinococcus arboris]|uniref:hypothetical protein n=1 Tax=Deinococcus arboris TaxID=2682977 RepID=UPI0034E21D37
MQRAEVTGLHDEFGAARAQVGWYGGRAVVGRGGCQGFSFVQPRPAARQFSVQPRGQRSRRPRQQAAQGRLLLFMRRSIQRPSAALWGDSKSFN